MDFKSDLVKEVWDQFGRCVVWLPGTPMRPGDIGVIDKEGGFIKRNTLEGLGVEVEVDLDESGNSYQVTSTSGIEVASLVKGETESPLKGIPAGNAALGFTFSRERAFALYIYNVRVNRISNLEAVEEWMLGSGEWNDSWVCIAEAAVANPSILAISAGSDASANIDLGAEISGPAQLGQVDAKIGIAFQKNLAAQSVSHEPTAVMWRGRAVKGFWNPRVEDVRQFVTAPREIEDVDQTRVLRAG